ncbi:MAG: hypothetical protein KDA89_12585 [Planctomycetaceae bacterium]|nr:hypothetical protein [Planctomycetaceae bacterium]
MTEPAVDSDTTPKNTRSSGFPGGLLLLAAAVILLSLLMRSKEGPRVDPVPQVDGDAELVELQPDGSLIHRAVRFQEALAIPNRTVVVDFWAQWCGPCQMMAPELEKLIHMRPEDVVVVKVDIDQNSELSRHFQISSIPDLRFFRNGRAIGGAIGYRTADGIAAAIPE